MASEDARRMEFMAEIVQDRLSDDSVPFRYVIDGSAALSIPRKWWDELGRPDVVFIQIAPDSRAP
jgi:hypothetical protein